jgi:hypothetical protein
MERINSINTQEATGITKVLLDDVQKKRGLTPGMMRSMAQSSAVLEGDLNFNGALAGGELSAKLREQIALVVGECNGCIPTYQLESSKIWMVFQLLNRRTI